MPDSTAAPVAPQSPYAHRLDVLKRYRRREAGEKRKARALTAQRTQLAEMMLVAIIDGTDFLADVTLRDVYHEWPGVALLVTISKNRFNRLCEIGAELEEYGEDIEGEDTQDLEPDEEGGPNLGSTEEASATDQTRWAEGSDSDGEHDRVDEEPSPLPPDKVEAARARVRERVAAGKPEDGLDAIRNGKGDAVLKRDGWGIWRARRGTP